MKTDEQSASELAQEYEYYYEQCEKANKRPLSFREWLDAENAKQKH